MQFVKECIFAPLWNTRPNMLNLSQTILLPNDPYAFPGSLGSVHKPHFTTGGVLGGQGAGYTFSSDVYSLRCVLHELACLRAQFKEVLSAGGLERLVQILAEKNGSRSDC